MKDYIPTIEELRGKPARELHAIFRRAVRIAADATRKPEERAAASSTVENVRRCLATPPGP